MLKSESPAAKTRRPAAAGPPSAIAPENRCDRRALPVAQATLAAAQADLVILFGSRARGDYDPRRSDIDIMLLQDEEPDADGKETVKAIARAAARESYGAEVPTQLVWRTLAQFRQQRRYVNSVETNAIRDGIVMPRHPENYRAADYEDEEVEYAYDWSPYSERLRHAEIHLEEFAYMADQNRSDLVIGQQAQAALEHGMKALLEAHGSRYRRTHNIGELLGNIRHADPEMKDFRLAIPPEVYTEYAGGNEYHPREQPELTSFPDYLGRTVADAQAIIDRAKQVRAQQ